MLDPSWHLTTPRLFISHLLPTSEKHAELIFTLYDSPHFIATEGRTGVTSLEKAQNVLKTFEERQAKYGFGQYLVSLKSANTELKDTKLEDAVPIGTVSLMIAAGHYTVPDVGFAILEEYTGKGYATEAGKEITRYAMEDLKLAGVFGFTSTKNEGSRRVMEKIGLQYRGTRRLKAFGGIESLVFALPDMNEDLKVYGIGDDE